MPTPLRYAPAMTEPLRRALAWALVAATLVACALAQRAPESPRADALLALHARVLGDGPRFTGTAAAAAARARIAAALTEAGCPPHEQRAFVCGEYGACAHVVNLWCRLGPEGGPAVVGMAHTDSVAQGAGAGDDGAGVVAWVDAVGRLARAPLRRPFVLVLTDAEEVGLLGAKAFYADPPAPIGEVVNLDNRGTSGRALWFEAVGRPRAWAAAPLAVPLAGSTLYTEVWRRMPNGTDLTAAPAEVDGIAIGFIGGLPTYHTRDDDRAHLDPNVLAEEAALAYGWVLALQDAPARALWFHTDVLGVARLAWPGSWTAPLAILAALAAVGVLVVDVRRGLSAGALAGAGGATLVAAIVAVVLPEGLGLLLLATRGPVGWGSPGPVRLATWLLVAASFLPVGRLDPRGRWHAVVLLLAALTLGLAVLAPAWTVATLPVLGAALVTRPLGLGGLAVAGALFWGPYALGLETALMLVHPVMVAAPLAAVAAAAAPIVPRVSWRTAGGTAAAGLAAFGIAALRPAFTADAPQPYEVRWGQRDGGPTAAVTIRPRVGAVAASRWETAAVPLAAPTITWRSPVELVVTPARGGWLKFGSGDGLFVGATPIGHRQVLGTPPEGLVVRRDPPAGPLEVTECTPGLPMPIDDARFPGPHAPAHSGETTCVTVSTAPPGAE